VAQLDPGIAHPVVLVTGQQGSGKSTAMRMLSGLLDASPVPLRKPPKDVESWTVTAAGSWSIAVDNVSTIPAWWSDSLCRAVTGDGDVRRKLYSDGDLSVFSFRRCVWLNGIDLTADRGDLAERAVVARFDRLVGRRDERDLAAAWTDAHPRVLGVLLDLAVPVLAAREDVALPRDFRMIDFAKILAAVDTVTGSNGIERYTRQAHDLALDAVSGDPVLGAITEKVKTSWTGTSADLLSLLAAGTFHGERAREWPTTARGLTGHLHRTAPQLREVGWTVHDVHRYGPGKSIGWSLTPPATGLE
jgi:energy-coupling factor transporter ATP-binding protein EcfA2